MTFKKFLHALTNVLEDLGEFAMAQSGTFHVMQILGLISLSKWLLDFENLAKKRLGTYVANNIPINL